MLTCMRATAAVTVLVAAAPPPTTASPMANCHRAVTRAASTPCSHSSRLGRWLTGRAAAALTLATNDSTSSSACDTPGGFLFLYSLGPGYWGVGFRVVGFVARIRVRVMGVRVMGVWG